MPNNVPFADLEGRMPFEWESLSADTWVWCLHCERAFRFRNAEIDSDGLLMCAYFPECDGTALDYWPWSADDWARKMGGQERPEHWPAVPMDGAVYPLYDR
jgi:hypothetical protein